MEWFRSVDWASVRRDGHNMFTKFIRTRDPRAGEGEEINVSTRQRLSVSIFRSIRHLHNYLKKET